MNFREMGKRFNRWFARESLFSCSLIIEFLPKRWLYGFAEIIAIIGYYVAIKQHGIAQESLSLAFGRQFTRRQRVDIIKRCFRNMAKSGLEILYVLKTPEACRRIAEIEGRQYLDEALSRYRGVIIVSAHFGNFPLALTRLNQEGYKINAILKRMRDDKMEEFLESRRRRVGINSVHTLPRLLCIENSLKVLRNNEVLFIQLDQNFGTGGIFVDFFGKKAATATGPVVLALRTHSPILPMFIVRQPDNTHKIIIEPEIVIEKKDTTEETLQFNIQRITSIIESYIRRYPCEWGWIHRRWKSQINTH